MSAFFNWDTEPVKLALLNEINRSGYPQSDVRDPKSDRESEWLMLSIKMDGYGDKEYYTDTWDIEFWKEEQMDSSVVYKITAYPMYDMGHEYESHYSSWITLHTETILEPQEESCE
jgi:hypothetical protein